MFGQGESLRFNDTPVGLAVELRYGSTLRGAYLQVEATVARQHLSPSFLVNVDAAAYDDSHTHETLESDDMDIDDAMEIDRET